MTIAIKPAERLMGCDGRHFVVVGEVVDLYVMRGVFDECTVFAYEDRECVFVGTPHSDQAGALEQFVRAQYGKAAQWSIAA